MVILMIIVINIHPFQLLYIVIFTSMFFKFVSLVFWADMLRHANMFMQVSFVQNNILFTHNIKHNVV